MFEHFKHDILMWIISQKFICIQPQSSLIFSFAKQISFMHYQKPKNNPPTKQRSIIIWNAFLSRRRVWKSAKPKTETIPIKKIAAFIFHRFFIISLSFFSIDLLFVFISKRVFHLYSVIHLPLNIRYFTENQGIPLKWHISA